MPSEASSTFLRGNDEFTRVLAFRDGLFAIAMTLLAVLFFLLSMPLPFVSTTLAVCAWCLIVPAEMLLIRRAPAEARNWL